MLATFEDASTVTSSASPARGVVELRPIQRICGAASGGSIRIVGIGAGVGDGEPLAVGNGLGGGDCACVTAMTSSRQAMANAGRMGGRFEARVWFPPNQPT
jgi:hypothetical protein